MEGFNGTDLISTGPAADAGVVHGHGIAASTADASGAACQVLATGTFPAHQPTTVQKIPLVCTICPKNSTFSDVSHLLTHIASKGHLSNKFQLDIAKDVDDFSRESLEEYETWFETYNIRDLLLSRSENRKSQGRGQARADAMNSNASLRGGGHGTGVSLNSTRNGVVTRAKRRFRGGNANTQSINHSYQVKCEPEDDIDSTSNMTPSSYGPYLHNWQSTHGIQDYSYGNQESGMPYIGGGNFAVNFADGNEDPADDDVGVEEDHNEELSKYEPTDDEDDDDDDDDDGLPSDNTKDTTMLELELEPVELGEDVEARERRHCLKYLKGEVSRIPGAGVFDAAFEAQRKQRNQKKHPSVAANLEVNSRAVKKIESVSDIDLNWVRDRDPFVESSVDDSMDSDVDAATIRKPKRRTPQQPRGGKVTRARGAAKSKRTILRAPKTATAASGTGRGRGGRRGARGVRGASIRRATTTSTSSRASSALREVPTNSVAANVHTTRSSRGNLLGPASQYHNGLYAAQSPHDIISHSFAGNRGFDVFRDNVESGRGPTESSAPQRRQNNLPGLKLRPGHPNLPLLSPTPVFKRQSSRFYNGKENIQPQFQIQPTSTNPYLNSHNSHGENSLNPLCVHPQESNGFRAYSSYIEDTKPLNTGFQSITGETSYDGLPLASGTDEGYQTNQRQHGGVYDI
ncbi:hypothetical protein BJ170DRAFT_684868 [Xylariales sp. AK1849]|nr:hypothetical protein BJ170DRAFT_684868 [Xylariales sp. AK1849]